MLNLFIGEDGVTNTQDQSDMPHNATYAESKEDSNPAENYDELCLILEKSLKGPLFCFTQVVGESVCK